MQISSYNLQRGQAMIIMVVLFIVVSSSAVIGSVTPTVRQLGVAQDIQRSKQSYFLAEAGVEDVIHRLKHGLEVSNTETLTIGDTTAETTVTSQGGNEYAIESLGDTLNRERLVSANIVTAAGYSFSYGVQVGTGGFDIGGNAGVIGNVFANGPIIGESNSFITGTALSAGPDGLIEDVDDIGEEGVGDALAHTVNGVTVAGNLYCQVGSRNNKSCDTSQADPELQSFPLTEEDYMRWENQASEGILIEGDYNVEDEGVVLGPAIITGDLNMSNNASLTLTGTVWVQGSFDANNNVFIDIDSSYGTSGEVLLVDGYAHLSNNVDFDGSGEEGSYVMLVNTSECPEGPLCDGNNAIELDNNVGTVILSAQYGTIYFSNNAGAVSATAETIQLANNAVIVYEQGLINVHFSSGPSGTFSVDGWGEQ